jgi:hypothetical protein
MGIDRRRFPVARLTRAAADGRISSYRIFLTVPLIGAADRQA